MANIHSLLAEHPLDSAGGLHGQKPGTWCWWRREHTYCWWKKSCTSWYGKYPTIYRVLYIPSGVGFLPSTVCIHLHLHRYTFPIVVYKVWTLDYLMWTVDTVVSVYLVVETRWWRNMGYMVQNISLCRWHVSFLASRPSIELVSDHFLKHGFGGSTADLRTLIGHPDAGKDAASRAIESYLGVT